MTAKGALLWIVGGMIAAPFANAQGTRWVIIRQDDRVTVSVDTTSLLRGKNGGSMWVKTVFRTPQSISASNPHKYASIVRREGVDCEMRTLTTLLNTYYDSRGTIVATATDSSTFSEQEPLPESFEDSIMLRLCKVIRSLTPQH